MVVGCRKMYYQDQWTKKMKEPLLKFIENFKMIAAEDETKCEVA